MLSRKLWPVMPKSFWQWIFLRGFGSAVDIWRSPVEAEWYMDRVAMGWG